MKTEKLPQKEETFKGIGVSDGVAVGPVFLLRSASPTVTERKLESFAEVDKEKNRFRLALDVTRDQLKQQIDEATTKYGKDYAAIIESHFLILEDEEMIRGTLKTIQSQMTNAEAAFSHVMNKFRAAFLKSKNEYLRERAVDLEDVQRRVLRNLLGHTVVSELPETAILAADTVKPSDLMGLDRSKILGFISEGGTSLSHVAIVARSLNIPAVVGLPGITDRLQDCGEVLLDGHSGVVVLHSLPVTRETHVARWKIVQQELEELKQAVGLPCETLDGKAIHLTANVEIVEEVEHALRWGAQGIGLYRTEYMLLGNRDLPGEEEQYETYHRIAEKNHPHKITMRTFDVGGDKIPIDILSQYGYQREDNPFMGWRAIRIALQCPPFFVPQIRAILRLSARFDVEIMLPMIISPGEVLEAKRQIDECKTQLTREGIPFNRAIRVGIMIETPAAAMMADELAQISDFFSIGTNDLVQYTLATDRGNPKVSGLYNCFHPSVLHLIFRTIASAHRHGIPAAMCGEMASNPYATALLVGMEMDEFSVLPPVLPKIRKIIRQISSADAKEFAQTVLRMNDLDAIQKLVAGRTREILAQAPVV